MKARQKFMDDSLNEAFISFYKDFLTPTEMEEVIAGKDLWMDKKEVLERWSYKIGRTTRSTNE